MGLLADGQTMLDEVMTAEGQSIVIRRGLIRVTTTATPDDQQEEEVTTDGLIIISSVRKFAMNTENYGALNLPQAGDMITIGSRGYQVLPGASSRCFEWLDNRHLRISVNTRLVSGGP